jgi:DHA2 family multidrug resistance protein
MIGETLFITGMCQFITAPIAGRLITRVDPRFLIALGFGGFALGTWQASYVTKDWDFYELLIPQILRGCSLVMCFIPINNLTLGTMAPERMKNASGLFNLTRNLGGAVGLALINTVLNKRMDLHLARTHEVVAWGRTQAEETLNALMQAFASRGSDAELAATARLAAIVRRESLVMAMSDVFLIITITFVMMLVLIPIMRRPKPQAGPVEAH